jgi:hypothetical protein
MGSSHSCWHMALRCYTPATPSDTRRESGRTGAEHSHCCTSLANVFGCFRKS